MCVCVHSTPVYNVHCTNVQVYLVTNTRQSTLFSENKRAYRWINRENWL